jgi:hypothetical protein
MVYDKAGDFAFGGAVRRPGIRAEVIRVLLRGRDAGATDKLAGILMEHGIEVNRAKAPFKAGEKEYAAGTYVVPMAQPSKRFIRTLLDPETKMDDKFVAAEEARRKLKQPTEIYDVTAWSLPLLFNVEAIPSNAVSTGSFEAANASRIVPGQVHGGAASVGYLVPWGNQAAGRLLTAALRQDLTVHSSEKPFTQDSVKFPAGSLILKVAANPADLSDRLARLARETGAEIYGTNSGWVEDGVNFGSRWVFPIRKAAIAIAWDTPAHSGSAGATRFVLERQYGYPVTPIRTAQLAGADLSKFQVLILPDGGNYAGILGESGIARVKNWVASGGTIVALGDAVSFLGNSKVELLELVQENALREGDDKDKKPAEKTDKDPKDSGRVSGTAISGQADFEKVTRAVTELPDDVPGAIARVRIRPDYWLTAGLGETVYTMVEGPAIYAPVKADKGINAAYYDAADKLVASGHLWAENQKQMAFKPLVVSGTSGRGVVVGFTQDPNFRAIEDGLNILFLNAIFRGPAHAR